MAIRKGYYLSGAAFLTPGNAPLPAVGRLSVLMRTDGHIWGPAYGAAAAATGRLVKMDIMTLDFFVILKQDMTMARIEERGLPPGTYSKMDEI